MENFNLDFFNERKSKVSELANKYKGLKITKENLEKGKEAIKELKNERVEITKIAKETRSQALAFQKGVIQLEKDILSIIEPVENELMNQRMIIENEEFLPERKQKLKDINVDIEESILLKMTNVEYKNFYVKEQEKYLAEQVRIAKEKELEERRKQELKEAEVRAKKEAEERILEDKKNRYIIAFGDEPNNEILNLSDKEFNKIIDDKEEERRKIVEENARIEERRLAEEKAEREKIENERLEKERLENDKKEKERAEKNARFTAWKKEHSFNEETDEIKRIGNTFNLYRKISSITIE